MRFESTVLPLPMARGESAPDGAELWWLGQAGFLVQTRSVRILIDPYLSDSLAIKYKGKPHSHLRMMPPPVDPASLRDIDLVLASHGHSDHLDPGTLAPIAAANPACRFIVPASASDLALTRGVPEDRLVPANAFASISIAGLSIHPLPAAHEGLEIDDHGRHRFLGFVVECDGISLFHPGDCAPFPGLLHNLSPYSLDLALLPVNGRDSERLASGVAGNFSLEEAVALAENSRAFACLGHHYGMFDFNTIDAPRARAWLSQRRPALRFELAEMGRRYSIRCDGEIDMMPPRVSK